MLSHFLWSLQVIEAKNSGKYVSYLFQLFWLPYLDSETHVTQNEVIILLSY